ncbi:MAG: D-alanine--D-alanine ligase [Halobacteriovorax sp.]|nr:D-alanine--D-alanine ligase [Halobacteriovorax sp.]
MSKLRILVLVHEALVPPDDIKKTSEEIEFEPWVTEYHVISTLKKMKHEVHVLGVYSDLRSIRSAVDEINPHVIYNLLEEFDGEALFDQNVVSYLELLRVPYTGCNPRGLILARDKALAKKILTYHRIPTPKFFVFPKNKKVNRPKHLEFPLIVKCLTEEASFGISKASVVHNDEKLQERVEYINKKLNDDALVEQFVEGRELYVGIVGNYRAKALPVWELFFEKVDKPEKEFYSNRAKFNKKYRTKKGIKTGPAELDPALEKKIFSVCRRAYKVLNLSGYARIDIRLTVDEKIYILEANPNPDISATDELAMSALHAKIKYKDLLKKILSLGIQWSGSTK